MPYVILLFGVFACSTAVLFIRVSETDAALLSAYRLLVAALLLAPLTWRAWRAHPLPPNRQYFWRIAPPALFLALHFITWIVGARLTPAANATLIVNFVPVAMPFLLYFQLRERISRAEAGGTAIAFAGVLVLMVADFQYSQTHALGDAICFGSMLLYTVYLVAARKNRDLASVYLYIVPVYALAGLFCLLFAALLVPVTGPIQLIGENWPMELFLILGLGIVPTIFGHSSIAWALRVIPGQSVAVINLGQFVFAGVLAYFILDEIPHAPFYFASAAVVGGALVVIHYRAAPSS